MIKTPEQSSIFIRNNDSKNILQSFMALEMKFSISKDIPSKFRATQI